MDPTVTLLILGAVSIVVFLLVFGGSGKPELAPHRGVDSSRGSRHDRHSSKVRERDEAKDSYALQYSHLSPPRSSNYSEDYSENYLQGRYPVPRNAMVETDETRGRNQGWFGGFISSTRASPYPPRGGSLFNFGASPVWQENRHGRNGWTKIGVLTGKNVDGKDVILNLERRPIAPGQDLWQYQVQDRDDFVVSLDNTSYIEDGDTVESVIGKTLAPGEVWKVHISGENRWVWL